MILHYSLYRKTNQVICDNCYIRYSADECELDDTIFGKYIIVFNNYLIIKTIFDLCFILDATSNQEELRSESKNSKFKNLYNFDDNERHNDLERQKRPRLYLTSMRISFY